MVRVRLGAHLPHALGVALYIGPAAGLLELEQALLLLEGRHDHHAHLGRGLGLGVRARDGVGVRLEERHS